MDTRPNNLPLQLSSFIGREREIAETRHALESSRLVTLTGAGGSGKTRLALKVAAGLQDVFTDGVWFVDFAPLSDPALVAPKLAATLTIPEASSQMVLTSVISSFLDKQALFVFDNCEHLIDACAQLSETLLQSCAHLRVLATSREALRLTGELVLPVPPLSSPDPRHVQPPEALMRFDAVQLFTDRARAVRPAFALTYQNAEEVARICHRLDGIPLALELAAAHVGASSVKQIADRLDDRFQLLTGGHRTAVPRQRTLRATVQWSFDLLSEPERVLFRRLSVFAGGCTVTAAEAVAADESLPAPDIFIALTQLVNKSLVLADERDGATRYRMLETIRQYADELLRNCDELRPIRDRHLRYMLLLAEKAEPYFHGTREMPEWLDRLETEHDNIRAALAWCEAEGRPETGLALASALWWFWTSHSHLREGQDWLIRMLKQADGVPVLLRARAPGRELADLVC
jgi:predicted ATPase